DPAVVERVDVASNQLGDRAHSGASIDRGGEQKRLWVAVLEGFDDRQGLSQGAIAIDQRRHRLLRVKPREILRPMLSVGEFARSVLLLKTLEIESNADAESRRREEISVELHERPLRHRLSTAAVAAQAEDRRHMGNRAAASTRVRIARRPFRQIDNEAETLKDESR